MKIHCNEPYFVHIGFTYVHEQKKTKVKIGHRYKKLRLRPCVEGRVNKLKKYWKRSLR